MTKGLSKLSKKFKQVILTENNLDYWCKNTYSKIPLCCLYCDWLPCIIHTYINPAGGQNQKLYLLFHVVHPLVHWSHLSDLQPVKCPKHNRAKRVQEHRRLTTEFKQGVHQWTYSTAHTNTHVCCQDREKGWGLVWRERNDRLRWGERSREGKRDGNPKNGTAF